MLSMTLTHTHIIFNWHWVNEFFGDIFAMCMDSHTHIPLPSPSHTPTQISKQECIFIQLQFIQTGSTCSNFYHTNNQLVCTISFRKKVTIMEEKKGMYHQLNSYSIVKSWISNFFLIEIRKNKIHWRKKNNYSKTRF